MHVKRWLLIPVFAVLVACAGAQQPADATAVAAVADSSVAELLKAPVAGVAVAVARGDRVLFRKAWGWADVEARTPLTLSDVHQIGSLTKQFTAAAILQLVEQGRMSLDDPVQKYLPGFDTQGHTVTIHHLLNHTSGIRSYTSIFGMNPVPRATLMDTIQKHPFDFPPGTRFLYNNSGYYLLGPILEAVTGTPYAQYLEQALFEPLGMRSTSYCGFAGEPMPVGYARASQALTSAQLSDMEFPGAAGGLCSTADDLLVWQRALVSGRVVQPATYTRMTTPAALSSGAPMSYGYGLSTGRVLQRSVIAHGGGIPGFSTFMSWYPAESLGIVVLVNTSPGFPERIEQAIARAAFGLPRPVVKDLRLDAAERSRYVGTYDLGELRVRIFEQGDHLMTQAAGQSALRMKYQGNRTFLLDSPREMRLEFEMDDGRASGFALFQGGAEVRAARLPGT
jgi:CubicO group peptidase (beta-lactamase class C family)